MIRTLRNSGFGQIFLSSIVVAIILAFLFTGAPSSSGSAADECAVSVGKSCVSPKEFIAAYRLLSSIGLNEKAAKGLRLKEKVAQGLAEREVLLKEALRLGIGTSEDDIDNEIFEGRTRVSLPVDGAERLAANLAMCVNGPSGCAPGTIGLRAIAVQRAGVFNFEVYKRTVRVVSGRSTIQFKEMQQAEYTAERVRQLIRSQVKVSPSEAFLAYSRARSQATARTVEIQSAWFQRYLVAPSEEEVQAWVKKNKEAVDEKVKGIHESWQVGCSVVSELRLDNGDATSDETVDVKKKASKLRTLLQLRKSFDKIARAESASESASLGGRTGCLSQGYGPGATVLIEAAGELTKPGDLSPVLETIVGQHIVQLLGRVTEKNRDDLAREYFGYRLAAEALSKEAAKKFAQDLIKRTSGGTALSDANDILIDEMLKESAFEKEESLARLADDAPKSDVSRAVSIEQSPIASSIGDESPAALLFSLEKNDDVAQKPIATQAGFVVMQLKSKDMITQEKFEEERVSIMATLQKRKAEQALSDHVRALVLKAGGIRMNPKFVPPLGSENENEEKSEKDS